MNSNEIQNEHKFHNQHNQELHYCENYKDTTQDVELACCEDFKNKMEAQHHQHESGRRGGGGGRGFSADPAKCRSCPVVFPIS